MVPLRDTPYSQWMSAAPLLLAALSDLTHRVKHRAAGPDALSQPSKKCMLSRKCGEMSASGWSVTGQRWQRIPAAAYSVDGGAKCSSPHILSTCVTPRARSCGRSHALYHVPR